MKALHAKRCWSIIKGESVWAHYMVRKYGDPSTPGYSLPYQPSPLWRAIVELFPMVSRHCTWVAGRGNIPIWGVNWSGTILPKPHLFNYIPNIRQVINSPFVRVASGASVDVRSYLSEEAKYVLNAIVLSEDKDQVCWTLNQKGDFSTKSFWDHYRIKFPIDSWSHFYWNKYIQPRVGAFLWRLRRNAIPVDARLLSMGYNLVSRCSCCENPETETLDHLFVLSETASTIWRHFANLFHLSSSPTDIENLAQVWLNNASLSSPSGISRNIIFGNVLWEIWKQRNEIIFGKGKRNCNFIVSRVSATLQQHLVAFHLPADGGVLSTHGHSDTGQSILGAADPHSNRRAAPTCGHPPILSAPWKAPAFGLKLNLAGRLGDPPFTAGGGIIRDNTGSFIVAFSFYMDNIAIHIPELEALLYSAFLCRNRNWVINEIETASQRLINVMTDKEIPPWALIYKLRKFGRVSALYRCSGRSPPELMGWQKLYVLGLFHEGSPDLLPPLGAPGGDQCRSVG
ncbi:uncharacterized protein M6B38_120160 [Iris pallida]|uniref:Reverse transcriptase zinc-binding domain-containing protein n=1 Tax=Iris pallida TaxID=29817 RepID=A0AAX6H9J6_IRIPA|nr:uncharacterized protein M6B38_120160 [Iris pallida]